MTSSVAPYVRALCSVSIIYATANFQLLHHCETLMPWYSESMKKKTSKKVSKPQPIISLSRSHIMVKRGVMSSIVIGILVLLVAVLVYSAFGRIAAESAFASRLTQIQSIYTSFNLGDSYRTTKVDMFGDRRVYEWDKSRTYSSSVEYTHNDTVSGTFADLKSKIEAAGFKQFETAYEGSLSLQYHFKNSSNQYVRVSVIPKSYEDTMMYGGMYQSSYQGADENAAPSYVTIKVNLDDNNE